MTVSQTEVSTDTGSLRTQRARSLRTQRNSLDSSTSAPDSERPDAAVRLDPEGISTNCF